jgi:hypothetical protein
MNQATPSRAAIAALDAKTLEMLINNADSVRRLLDGAMAVFSNLSRCPETARELDTDEKEISSFLVSATETLSDLDELEATALAALEGIKARTMEVQA